MIKLNRLLCIRRAALRRFEALLLAVCVASAPNCVQAVSAKGYALVEQSSGRLIDGSNETSRMPMASTTKIMTGLLAAESGRLDETITVPAEALTVEGSSMGLLPEEQLTLRQVVYGLMLESGNDAANTVALELGGSIPAFASMMNAKAEKLGLSNTHFQNPSGLNEDGHYTCALDLARLGAAAMKNRDFAAVVGTRSTRVDYNGVKNGRNLVNHNRLLGSYDGEIGIKTGFTKKSGRCLVSCAARGGVTLVLATLNDPDDWDDHKALLDKGFQELKSCVLLEKAPSLAVRVKGGVSGSVPAVCGGAVCASLRDGEQSRVKMKIRLPKSVSAPVDKGKKLGEIVFELDGAVISRTDLTAACAVAKKPNPAVSFFDSLGAFFRRVFHIGSKTNLRKK